MVARQAKRAAVAVALAWAMAASAQEAPGGGHRRFDDPLLDSLVGRWNISREIRGKRERNTLDVEWVLQHQFLELHMKDAAEPPQYEALVLLGEDRADGRYVVYWCDTFGGKLSAAGHGKRTGDAIELVFDYPEGPFYNTFSRDPAKGTWTFLMEGQGKDGKRTFFARDTLSRR